MCVLLCVEERGGGIRTKFPTTTTYANCRTPTTTRKARKMSRSFVRCGVLVTYLSHIPCVIAAALVLFVVLGLLGREDAACVGADGVSTVPGVRCFGAIVYILCCCFISERERGRHSVPIVCNWACMGCGDGGSGW